MNAGCNPPGNEKTFRTIPVNPEDWWNTLILHVPSIPGSKPNASDARRMIIRTPGTAPGGFQFEMRVPLPDMDIC
jgi:hypothetical protein